MKRKAERQESLMQRLGGGLARGVEWAWGTEENPSWLQAAVELLSTPSYVGTSALDYARQDKSAFQGALEGAQLGVSPLLKKLGMHPKKAKAKKQMWSDVGAEEVSKMFPTVPEYSSGAGLATLANFIPRAVGGLAGLGIDFASDPLTWLSAGGEGVVKMATRALAKEGLAALSLGTKVGRAKAARILANDYLKTRLDAKAIHPVTKVPITLADVKADRPGLRRQFKSAIEKAYKTEGPFNLRTRTVFGEPNLEYGAAEIVGKGYKRLPFTSTYEQAGKSPLSRLGRALGVPRGVTAVKQVLAPYLQGLDNALHYQIPLPTRGPMGAVTKMFFKPVEREVPWLREQAPGEIGAAGIPSSRQAFRPPSPPAGGAAVPTPPAGPTAPPAAGRTTEDFEDLFNQAMDALEVEKRAPAVAEAPKVQMPDVEIGKSVKDDVLESIETSPEVRQVLEQIDSVDEAKAILTVEGPQMTPEVRDVVEEATDAAKLSAMKDTAAQVETAVPPKVMSERATTLDVGPAPPDTPLRQSLRYLAEKDLQKQGKPGVFNKFDSDIAYDLLSTPKWSKKQEELVKKIVERHQKHLPSAKKMTLAVSPTELKALKAQKKVVTLNIRGAAISEAKRKDLRAELRKAVAFEEVQAIADKVSAIPIKGLSVKKLRTTLPGPDTVVPTDSHLRELIIRRLKAQIYEDHLRPSMRQGPSEPILDLDAFLDYDKGNRNFRRIDFGDAEFDSQAWNRMEENEGKLLRNINFGNDEHPAVYRGNEDLGTAELNRALKEEKELTEEEFKRWQESNINLSSKISEVGEEGQKVLDVDLREGKAYEIPAHQAAREQVDKLKSLSDTDRQAFEKELAAAKNTKSVIAKYEDLDALRREQQGYIERIDKMKYLTDEERAKATKQIREQTDLREVNYRYRNWSEINEDRASQPRQADLFESKPPKAEPLKENAELVAKRHARRVIKETEEKIEYQEGFIARTREKMKNSSEFEREFEEKAIRRVTQEIEDLRNGDEYLKAKSLIEGRVLKETDAEMKARLAAEAQEVEIRDEILSIGKEKPLFEIRTRNIQHITGQPFKIEYRPSFAKHEGWTEIDIWKVTSRIFGDMPPGEGAALFENILETLVSIDRKNGAKFATYHSDSLAGRFVSRVIKIDSRWKKLFKEYQTANSYIFRNQFDPEKPHLTKWLEEKRGLQLTQGEKQLLDGASHDYNFNRQLAPPRDADYWISKAIQWDFERYIKGGAPSTEAYWRVTGDYPNLIDQGESLFSIGKGKGAESIPKTMREMRGETPLAQAVKQGKLSPDYLKPVEALMDASPAFRRDVEVLYTEKSYKAPRTSFEAHGYSASEPDKILKGWAELNDAGKSFLTISKHADSETAAHEAGHFAQKYLLRGNEMQTVQKLHGVSGSKRSAKEWFSDEFAKWLNEKPFHQGLAGFFRNIADTFVRAFKALGGDSAAKLEQIFERAIKREKMVPLAFEPKSLKMSIGPTKQTVTFTDLAGNQQTVEATVRRVNVGQPIRKVMGEDTSLKTWGLKKAGGGGLEEGRFIEIVLPPMSEKVTFYERTGLTKMLDTLITPISRIHKIDPILNERGRQFDAKMLVHKQEIDQAATLFAKQFSDPKDLNQFHRYIEDPAFAGTLDPKKAQEFADAKVIWDNWFDAKTGILPKMLEESGLQKNFWEEYISHIRVTRPEMDWDEIATKTSSALSSWEKFKLHRVNTDLDTLIKEAGKGTYEENAAVILGIRLYSGYRVLEKKAYLNQLLNKRSQDLGLVFKGAESRPGYIAITGHEPNSEMFPQLKGWSIREDVYLHLNHQFEEWKTNLVYWNLLAKIQRFWKPIATIYNPKFHARNFEGNLWNNFLKGVVNPNRYFQAAAVQSEAINKRLGGIKIKLGEGYEVGADELRKLFLEEGLLNRGAFSADMGEIISKTLQREIKGAGSLKGKLIDMPRKVGQAIEDNARIALAIDRLEKGDDVAGMMAAVREALFDYDEITPWEKGVRRSVLPFYVWYRKNIPLQIRYFFKQPGKFSAAVKTASAIEGEKGRKEREEIQPDWMKKAHGFNLTPLLGKTKTGEQRLAGAALPYEDPFRFAENPGRELAGQLNPGIRLPVEMFFREDIGTGQKWDKPGLEGTGLSGKKVENLIGNLPKPLWPIFGIRQFNDPETGVKVTEMRPEFYNLWRTMFRPGRELAAMADTEKDALTRVLNQVMTMIEVDPEKAKFFKAWRRTKRNAAILKEAQRDIPFGRKKYR